MKFLSLFIASLNRKSFYKSVLDGKEKMGFTYVAKLEVVATLFIVIIVSINISGILPTLDKKARTLLPAGAEIIIKDGALLSNINPVIIPMPNGVVGEAKQHANLFVLDTTTELTKEDINKKDTFILVNSEGVISRTDGVSTDVTKFSEIPGLDISLDQEWFIERATWIREHAKYVPFLLFFPILVSFYLIALFWALIYGLLAYIILRMHGLQKPFKIAYSIGLYSRTFGLVVSLFMLIVPVLNIAILSIPLNIFFIYSMLRQTLPKRTGNTGQAGGKSAVPHVNK